MTRHGSKHHDGAHTFRFFSDAGVEQGDHCRLSDSDSRHAQVIRLRPGDAVELVDSDGAVWQGTFEQGSQIHVQTRLVTTDISELQLPAVTACIGFATAQAFDAAIDQAVQAGATTLVPVVTRDRDVTRLDARIDRFRRIAYAAAKQAKRQLVPAVTYATTWENLDRAVSDTSGNPPFARYLCIGAREPGIARRLTASIALARTQGVDPYPEADATTAVARQRVVVCIGAADGIDHAVRRQLRAAGWQGVGLGPTVLRTETAVAVAVSTVLQTCIQHHACP